MRFRFCWPTLLLTLMVLLIFLIPAPQPAKRTLVAGSDMFWETYEQRFGCSPCPSEDIAIDRLKGLGYDVDP